MWRPLGLYLEASKLRSPSSSSRASVRPATSAMHVAGPNFQAPTGSPSPVGLPDDLRAPEVVGPIFCRRPCCPGLARPSTGYCSERCEELALDLKHYEDGWA